MKLPKDKSKHKDLDWFSQQNFETQMEILNYYTETIRLLANEIMENEVREYAGERYSHDKPHDGRYDRWGTNPGSIQTDKGKIPIYVPRIYDKEKKENKSLESYQKMHNKNHMGNSILPAILGGLSMGRYEEVVQQFAEGFGLSQSSVSDKFIEESADKLEHFEQRRLEKYNFVSIFIDGKNLAGEQIIIVLGVTQEGRKIPLSFIQSYSENSKAIGQMLEKLKERGFDYSSGLLCVIDGAKGIRKAIKDKFGDKALIQRCRYHKRDNILSYLNESDQDYYKKKIDIAYSQEKYSEAKSKLLEIKSELKEKNISAANSLEEGLEETLTLHRLELNLIFDRTFSTTNPIENINRLIKDYTRNVSYWKNSQMRYRWIASALLECERNMRRVNNYRKLDQLQKKVSNMVQKKEENQ